LQTLVQLIVHFLVGRSSFRWLFRVLVSLAAGSNFFVILTLLLDQSNFDNWNRFRH
jgi:hypothetical protein